MAVESVLIVERRVDDDTWTLSEDCDDATGLPVSAKLESWPGNRDTSTSTVKCGHKT